MELIDITVKLKDASVQVPEGRIDRFIGAVDIHKRIFVYGTRRSGLMSKVLTMRLTQVGHQSYVVGEITTPSAGERDLLTVTSASGKTQSVCGAADGGAKQGIDMLVITGSKESTLSRNHESPIRIETAIKFSESKVNIQPPGSLFEQILLLTFDAVILKVSSRNTDMNRKVAKRHASVGQ